MDTPIGTDGRSRSAMAGPESVEPEPRRTRTPQTVSAWPWWLMRVIVTIQALDALLQAVFAGRFLSGDFNMLLVHRANGTQILLGLCLLQVIASVIAWRRAGVPGWIPGVSVLLLAACGVQVSMGFNRVLGVHIPLGVIIIGAVALLAIWVWRHGPATMKDRT
jgi:hypothetical protein